MSPASAGPPRTAFILIVGDEILSGEVVDENAAHLARKLTGLGIRVAGMRVVPDTLEGIAAAVEAAAAAAELVFVSGGIGPTHDDLTRQAVAAAFGVACERHREAEAHLRQGYGAVITEAELKMADLPRGARVLPGVRPGVYGFRVDRVHVLPGIPALLREIFDQLIESWEPAAYFREEMVTRLREGNLADALGEIQADHPAVAIGSYPVRTEDGYRVRIVLRARDRGELERARARVAELLGGGAGLVGVPGRPPAPG